MPTRTPRPAAGRARLAVTVTAPDGAAISTRGLASWLSGAAPARARGEVTVALVSDARMRTLNRIFRGKDYATDVLSFPAAPAGERRKTRGGAAAPAPAASRGERYLGDIVIAAGVAARQAEEAGHSGPTELRVLALHGLLHLLGFDHESDEGQMARAEARLRKRAGLKDGLISRTTR